MEDIIVSLTDERLRVRYQTLVKAHMHTSTTVAAGPTAVHDGASALAATQAAWRFFNNERVTLEALAQPLRRAGAQAALGCGATLLVHDWSKIDYASHTSKQDTMALTHEADIGYELTTALLVSGDDGSPLAPMQMHLKTAGAVLSTGVAPGRDDHHLEQVLPAMEASRQWGVPAAPVHVIDREADSVDHLRRWHQAGHRYLVRGDDRRVMWQDREMLLSSVVCALKVSSSFAESREVEFQGRKMKQFVAETTVTLHRPAKKKNKDGTTREVAGPPLTLRLIAAQVRDGQGQTVATWMLLTNVAAADADAATIALWYYYTPAELPPLFNPQAPSLVDALETAQWSGDNSAVVYYWRWRIESFFKLLKSAGQQMEQWQQETGPAIARRLLVAAMACVMVWQLERQTSEPAQEMKKLLVRLSGRQMKRARPVTASALLAGLFVLLPLLDLLASHGGDLSEIQRLAEQTLPMLIARRDV